MPAQDAAIRLAAPVSAQPNLADFADFVRSSQAKMVRLAELLTGDRGRAEDLAQDGYAKAYAAWTRIRGGDPQAYVRRCIVNANTDWPEVLAGTVRLVPGSGDSFAIRLDGRHGVTSYAMSVSPTMWRDKYGNWWSGTQPACLRPRSHGQHITFGVVNVKPGPAFGGPVVMWVECARSPVPRYPIVTPKASGPA